MPKKREFTKEEDAIFETMWRAGKGYREMADRFAISTSRVFYRSLELGLPEHPNAKPQFDRALKAQHDRARQAAKEKREAANV